ncbi:translation initiation factor IF-2, partial [Sphingomonas sp.]|uniref:translation initiation factor IF-2 n=1 Tax=Sphingomonas sp. TaxID=28214 RepID=UPI002E2FFDFD
MSETDNDKPKLGMRQPLGLKRTVETGKVKQSFSHGRSNTVVVEVKRRRLLGPNAAPVEAPVADPTPAPAPAPAAPVARAASPAAETAQERQARLMREAEDQRLASAEEARRREDAERHAVADEEKRRAEERARTSGEKSAEAAPAPAAEKPAPAAPAPAPTPAPEPEPIVALQLDPSMPAPRRFSPVARPEIPKPQPKPEPAPTPAAATAAPAARALPSGTGQATPRRGAETAQPQRPGQRGRTGDERRGGKLTVNRALGGEDGARARSLAALKRAREKEHRRMGGPREAQAKQVRDVQVPEAITVQELANRMAEKGADLVKALFKMGSPVTLTQTIDQDTAELLVTEFGHNIVRVSESDIDLATDAVEDAAETLKARPPVVTIMGHVDHGKTSLLDALRGTDVVRGEAGGITQHIGAYQVTLKDKSKITFLDTPGHEAFSEMRARGANVTDIVVLVVAGDDGIMPQTVEAIRHAKAANVPILVAINKMDKPDANAQRVRQELLNHELVTEELGGDVLTVEVSAKTKLNLDKLEETLLLQAEVLDLKANPDRAAQGAVIEAKLERGRGAVATLLVQKGTLHVGDIFVAGTEWGRVRALLDDKGNPIESAGPAMPVEVLGLQGTPQAGDVFSVVESEARAREVTEFRVHTLRQKTAAAGARGTLEEMFSKIQAGEARELPVVV